jgi:UDP-glucose 4-epimerase
MVDTAPDFGQPFCLIVFPVQSPDQQGEQAMMERYFIVGGAGFIGSHFCDALLEDSSTKAVTVYDNFSSGRVWHCDTHIRDSRFKIVKGDVRDLDLLRMAMQGHETVVHLASNPDIARAVREPQIDFDQGTVLTSNVLEAMRQSGARRILYASGSGVYGDRGTTEAREDDTPLLPISTYGASKLAGEALISAYAYMFELSGCAFRFGNVVGPRQTHGVGFDFLRRLRQNPEKLTILGDGTQSKSYIHVRDVVAAVLLANRRTTERFVVYNVATGDYITVTEIAKIAAECLRIRPRFEYTGGDRGWKGDVPIVRLATNRIRAIGWRCILNSGAAVQQSIAAMMADQRVIDG